MRARDVGVLVHHLPLLVVLAGRVEELADHAAHLDLTLEARGREVGGDVVGVAQLVHHVDEVHEGLLLHLECLHGSLCRGGRHPGCGGEGWLRAVVLLLPVAPAAAGRRGGGGGGLGGVDVSEGRQRRLLG